jgi:hypothetical protein
MILKIKNLEQIFFFIQTLSGVMILQQKKIREYIFFDQIIFRPIFFFIQTVSWEKILQKKIDRRTFSEGKHFATKKNFDEKNYRLHNFFIQTVSEEMMLQQKIFH